MKIFISYSSKDDDYVKRLTERLDRWHLSYWFDHRIEMGQRWWPVIEKQIDDAACCIVLVSQDSRKSHFVNEELIKFIKSGKPIFPISLDGEKHGMLQTIQHRDAIGGSLPGDEFFEQLCSPSLARQVAELPKPVFQATWTNGIGMNFCGIEAGSFRLGADESGPGLQSVIREPFFIGMHPVTQEQFAHVVGHQPSVDFGGRLLVDRHSARHPVQNVTWSEAIDFCQKLNDLETLSRSYAYRLPTEAEWEYVCRAGRKPQNLRFSEGAFCTAESSRGHTSAVGEWKEPPHPWGVRDLLGNVYEWCLDLHASGVASDSLGQPTRIFRKALENPTGDHVVKGGSWHDGFDFSRPEERAARNGGKPSSRIGFRVVLAPGVPGARV